MTTHATKSILENYRRPSGGLGGTLAGVELDWEPGDPPIEFAPALLPYWWAIKLQMRRAIPARP